MARTYSIAMVAACPFPANYGTPGAIREMSVQLAAMGHRVHVVTYPFGDDLPVDGLTIHRVGTKKAGAKPKVGPSLDKLAWNVQLMSQLCQVVREHRIDLIHAHAYEGALVGAVAKHVTGKPLLYHAVNMMGDELHTYRFIRPPFVANLLGRALDWFTPRLADQIVAVTPELERALCARGIQPEQIDMVPCGIEPEMFAHADPSAIRTRYRLGDRPVVMYTGVTNAFQRIDNLLRAFAAAREKRPDALLMVVSPLENEPDLPGHKTLADQLGLTPHVIWAGPHTLAKLPDYLACADVTVVPRCDCPGHPIKLLNYMMAGKPVACFAGAAKGVVHGETAWVVPDHDCAKLGDGIARLLDDQPLAERLSRQAQQVVRERFDWKTLCQKIARVYDAMIPAPAVASLPTEVGAAR